MKGPLEYLFDIATKVASLADSAGRQGTGAAYNPPTGGTGQIGYLSGVLKALGGTLVVRNLIRDSTGAYQFCPDECSDESNYDASGAMLTYTLIDLDGNRFTKTFTYDGNGRQTASSKWVKS